MRSKLSSVLVALVAALAVGGVASASASASTWWTGGAELKASAELAPTASVTQNVKLESSGGVIIECRSEHIGLTGASISPSDSGKIEHLVFKGCELISYSGDCFLNSTTIESKPLTVEAALGSKSPEDTIVLKPVAKSLFAEYTIDGESCDIVGVVKLEGKVKLTLTKGREELATQELSLNTGTSEELRWAGEAMFLRGKAELKLGSGKSWSFH